MKKAMDWFVALNKEAIRIQMNEKRHHNFLWAFAVASQKRSRTFVLTNGGFRFFWSTKSETGWVDVDVTFDNEHATLRIVKKATEPEAVEAPELKGVEA